MAPNLTIFLDAPECARKNHFVYDELGNIIEHYHGAYNLTTGDPCWKRVFLYESGKLVSTQDFYVTWHSDWDVE